MLEDCPDLEACENRLSKMVQSATLLGQAPLTDADLAHLGSLIRKAIEVDVSKGTRHLEHQAPTSLAVFLVWLGIVGYREGDYWSAVEATTGLRDINVRVRWGQDGCLYAYAGDPTMPALVLFDDVPGGAGHVRRVIKDKDSLLHVLGVTLQQMARCDCGGERRDTSCYGCLRNYRNQFCHDELKRGPVIEFLSTDLGLQV